MAKNKSPRKKYVPKTPRFGFSCPVTTARRGCALLTPSEIEAIAAPFNQAIRALREGKATARACAPIRTVLMILERTEKMGVVKEIGSYIEAAWHALRDISKRAKSGEIDGPWCCPTLRASELDALYDLQALYLHVLRTLSAREVDLIAQYVRNKSVADRIPMVVYEYPETV